MNATTGRLKGGDGQDDDEGDFHGVRQTRGGGLEEYGGDCGRSDSGRELLDRAERAAGAAGLVGVDVAESDVEDRAVAAAQSQTDHEQRGRQGLRRLVAAIVDRITFNAHILETGTQSYRLRTSKTSTRRKTSQLTSRR